MYYTLPQNSASDKAATFDHAAPVKFFLVLSLLAAGAHPSLAEDSPLLAKLAQGNHRYVIGQSLRPHQDEARRSEIASGQKPFAAVIGCSDSRTPPEILFDQGLGDLFVVRLAGNVLDEAALGSIEFAVSKLGVRLVLVLGHEKCGAVSAAVEALKSGQPASAHLSGIVEAIKPAVASVKDEPGDLVENAVRANVKSIVEKLRTSGPVLAPLVNGGQLQIVGSRYDLDNGQVEFLH
jgi:carbonic anhydrase